MQLVNVAKRSPYLMEHNVLSVASAVKQEQFSVKCGRREFLGIFNLVVASALTLLTVVSPSMTRARRLSKSILFFCSIQILLAVMLPFVLQ